MSRDALRAEEDSYRNGPGPAPAPDPPPGWLDGEPMDPAGVSGEPLPTIPGFPFAPAGNGILISGPTGGGRSSLAQACIYDAAQAGLRAAYLGSEVTGPEFNARAADLAKRRDDPVTDELRETLALARYLNLASVVVEAWKDPARWVATVVDRYDVVVIDPLSAVASALDLNFDNSNAEYVQFYDRLVAPLTTAGVAVVLLENIGRATDARGRSKGASAKDDRADVLLSCRLQDPGLVVVAQKVRPIRAAFQRDAAWIFYRDSQRVERLTDDDAQDHAATFRPTVLMRRVSDAVYAAPGLSKRAIRDAVTGRASFVDLALELLVAEGYVERREDGQANRYYPLKPFPDDRVPTVSDRVPDTRRETVSPCPIPRRGRDRGDAVLLAAAGTATVSPDEAAILDAAFSSFDAREEPR